MKNAKEVVVSRIKHSFYFRKLEMTHNTEETFEYEFKWERNTDQFVLCSQAAADLFHFICAGSSSSPKL